MSLLNARETFTHAFGDLLVFGGALCLQLSIEEECTYTLILDETKRSAEAAKWNAEHCREIEDGQRCEQIELFHQGGRIGHEFKPIGILKSVHRNALAGDLLVMRNGRIENDERIYKALGQFWKAQNDQLRWGGDFAGFKDLGHFSHRWNGRE